MNATELQTLLIDLDACEDARRWCEGKSLQEAWNECRRSDWMLWLIVNAEIEASDKDLRLIAVKCARQVQHLMKDERSINALDVAERYANGEATDEELAAARDAAGDAAEDAWDAADAALAAADAAARVAWDAAWAAARAAARDAAGDAAWAAARDAARDAARAAAEAAAGDAQSDIIREFIPKVEIKQTVNP